MARGPRGGGDGPDQLLLRGSEPGCPPGQRAAQAQVDLPPGVRPRGALQDGGKEGAAAAAKQGVAGPVQAARKLGRLGLRNAADLQVPVDKLRVFGPALGAETQGDAGGGEGELHAQEQGRTPSKNLSSCRETRRTLQTKSQRSAGRRTSSSQNKEEKSSM